MKAVLFLHLFYALILYVSSQGRVDLVSKIMIILHILSVQAIVYGSQEQRSPLTHVMHPAH